MLLLANANMLCYSSDRMFITGDQMACFLFLLLPSIVMLIASVLSGPISISIPRLGYYLGRKDYDSYKNALLNQAAPFYFLIIPTSRIMMRKTTQQLSTLLKNTSKLVL